MFDQPHSIADELAWLDSEGPASPAMIDYLERAAPKLDFILLFSYRYYHAWHRRAARPAKAVLVPTAERDPAIGLAIFGPTFRGVRAVMYNSHEERAMIHAAAAQPARARRRRGRGLGGARRGPMPERFRRKYNIRRPFAIYVGRIDENKGCKELFDFFLRYAATFPRGLDLVLVGSAIMPIPQHPASITSAFCQTRTSSTRWRRRIC